MLSNPPKKIFIYAYSAYSIITSLVNFVNKNKLKTSIFGTLYKIG